MTWYNKYRPQTFKDVIGQKLVKNVLENALSKNIIKNAYLLSGPKGTGKTTLARIFANSLNDVNENPEAVIDIVEMDAASNSGVDEVRKLIESSNIPPIAGKFKIYIIDEVHMMSKSAMNALLKTLEEPPKYLVFLLATTNPEKLIPTVLSRLTKLNLTNHSIIDIADQLNIIANKEKMEIDSKAIDLIAKRSNGGLRDAINLLETISSYDLDTYDLEKTSELLGLVNTELLLEILDTLSDNQLNKNLVSKIVTLSVDGQTLLGQLLDLALDFSLKNNDKYDNLVLPIAVLIGQNLPIPDPLTAIAILQITLGKKVIMIDDIPQSEKKNSKLDVSNKIKIEDTESLIEEPELPFSHHEEISLESLSPFYNENFKEIPEFESLDSDIEKINTNNSDQKISNTSNPEVSSINDIQKPEINLEDKAADYINNTKVLNIPTIQQDISSHDKPFFQQIIKELNQQKTTPPSLKMFLTELKFDSIQGNTIYFSVSSPTALNRIKSPKILALIINYIKEKTSHIFAIELILRSINDGLFDTEEVKAYQNIEKDFKKPENSNKPKELISEIQNTSTKESPEIFYEYFKTAKGHQEETKKVKIFKDELIKPNTDFSKVFDTPINMEDTDNHFDNIIDEFEFE
jgi:DNA polymerase III subunit gamma/tau